MHYGGGGFCEDCSKQVMTTIEGDIIPYPLVFTQVYSRLNENLKDDSILYKIS